MGKHSSSPVQDIGEQRSPNPIPEKTCTISDLADSQLPSGRVDLPELKPEYNKHLQGDATD